MCVRIFPLCVPRLSQSAEDQLVELVHCYLSTSSSANHSSIQHSQSANHSADDDDMNINEQCTAVYDVSSLGYDDTRIDDDNDDGDDDDGDDVVRQLNQGPWTLDNGE